MENTTVNLTTEKWSTEDFTTETLTTVVPVSTYSTPSAPNTTEATITVPPCQWILCADIHDSRVRIWDVIILIPNVLFLTFLLFRLRTAYAKLQRTNSPIFFAFYGLVFVVATTSVLRCVVSMTVNATAPVGHIADKVLWLVLRFFLLATELSVVIFGLAFGHLDSKTSIRRVLLVTFSIALIYSVVQGVLEFNYKDDRFRGNGYDIFGHGGMLFWFASSVFFFVVYTVICILPCTNLKNHFALPSKKSFYWYCGFLAVLNCAQAVGSGILHYKIKEGMCIVDVTCFIYFTCFAPLVYGTFLRDFFKTSQPSSILFSYKAHVDDDDDIVSLPHQTYTAPRQENDDGPEADLYDSTPIDVTSPNPLYAPQLSFAGSPELTAIAGDYYGQTADNDIKEINT